MSTFVTAIQRGTRGAQPAANSVITGTLYFVTDEGLIERSNGSTWQTYSATAGAGTVTHTGTLTANALMLGNGGVDITALGSLGTTSTVLHGNAAGAPTFGPVALASEVSGDLPFANLTQIAGLSVLGVTGSATADVAAITAGTDGYVLTRVSSSSMAFAPPAPPAVLEQHTASASATLDFTTFISSTYDSYLFEFLNILPATSTDDLWVRMGTGAGPTWDAGSNYTWAYTQNSQIPNGANLGEAGGAKIKIGNSLGTTSTKGASGEGKLYSPQSTSVHKAMIFQLAMVDSSGNFVNSTTGGLYLSTTAVTGIRFMFSTGNITSGTIRVYGIAK